MQIKKTFVFSVGDIQKAISFLAKQKGFAIRELTPSDLKEIVEKGSVSIEMDSEELPEIQNTAKILPFQFFIDVASRIHGLSVFVNNIDQSILYKFLAHIIEPAEEKAFLQYYHEKTSKTYGPSAKQIFGKDWKEKWDALGRMYCSVGLKLLEVLQKELRYTSKKLKGINNFKKDSLISTLDELGFSTRVSGHLRWHMKSEKDKPFTLGEFINEDLLKAVHSFRNLGKKSKEEIRDFILLYDL